MAGRVVHYNPGAIADGVDLERLKQSGIPLANNGGANSYAVSEHAILLMLAVYRRLPSLDRLVRSGQWKSSRTGEEQEHEDGTIWAAGIDAFDREPPDPKNPLFTLPNIVLSPHAAGPTWESWPKRFGNSYANIERVARGEAPLWVVPELRGG